MLRNACRSIVFCVAVLSSAAAFAGAMFSDDMTMIDNRWFFDVPEDAVLDGSKLNLTVYHNRNQVGTRPLSKLLLNNCTIAAKIKINASGTSGSCAGYIGVASGRDMGWNTFPRGVFIAYGHGADGYKFYIADSMAGEVYPTAGIGNRVLVDPDVEYTVTLTVTGVAANLTVTGTGTITGSPLTPSLRAPLASYWPMGQALIGRPHTTTDTPQLSATIDDVTIDTTDLAWAPPFQWTAVAGLPSATERHDHAAILLRNGTVLVAGGKTGAPGTVTDTYHVYNPLADTWDAKAGKTMRSARYGHAKGTVLLPNGKVLVTGGNNGSGALSTAEYYDPGLDTWTATPVMPYAYESHSAVLLPNGKVLVAGGRGTGVGESSYNKVCCLYDPDTNTWQTTGSSTDERTHAGFARLPNGKVIAAGGQKLVGNVSTSEIYDPGTGLWDYTGPFIQPPASRYPGSAILLFNGRVLAVGGGVSPGWDATERYDVNLGSWCSGLFTVPNALPYKKTQATLPDGRVLLLTTRVAPSPSCLMYDPCGESWFTPTSQPTPAGITTEMTALPDGSILIVGGLDGTGTPVSTCMVFKPGGTAMVPKPVIAPPGGTFSGPVNVTMTCSDPVAEIWYNIGDSTTPPPEPTQGAPSLQYISPAMIPIGTSKIIKAKAFKAATPDSETARADFFIDTVTIEPDRWSLNVLEGSTASVQVKLSRQPAGNVQVTAIMYNAMDPDLTLTSPGLLTFTPGNWNIPQTLTLAAAEDADSISGMDTLHLSSPGLTDVDIMVEEIDNDALYIVSDRSALSVPEGGTATFRVKLSQMPTSETSVYVSIASGDADIWATSGSLLTFTMGDWDVYQTVTLSAIEDFDLVNGETIFNLWTTGVPNTEVIATEIDNDAVNIIVDKREVTVFEGKTATFQVKLSSMPSAAVTVTTARSNGDADLSVTGGGSLTFSITDWDQWQTVTVSAAADADSLDGVAMFQCASPGLGGIEVTVTEQDKDSATSDLIVRTTMDDIDLPPPGSLRLAMLRVTGGKTIKFDENRFSLDNSEATTRIRLQGALPPLGQGNVIIDGQSRKVTLVGNDDIPYGLRLKSAGNTVMGLSIIGFQNGLLIDNAGNNTIGGSRLTGVGPNNEGNGQGLRLSENSENGILVYGTLASGNVIKGCWIGVDISGTLSDPNGSTGIHISGGASQNTIGGTGAGERNVISGNRAEGIVFSGAGTSLNRVINNCIGMDAFGSSPMANGSDGIFLELGSWGNQIGGTAAGEGNIIAHNGRAGVKVRDSSTIRNSVMGNRIHANLTGGIVLRGGNNNQTPPTIADVVLRGTGEAGSRDMEGFGRAIVRAPSSGTVELWNDSGSQGETLLGRSSATAGGDVTVTATQAVDTTQNITATFTDADGNTSTFAVYTGSPTLDSDGDGIVDAQDTDDDGDGFPDDVETALGTSPTDPSQTPLDIGALTITNAATADLQLKLSIKLNFSKTNSDSIAISGVLPLTDGFQASGQAVILDIGGVIRSFTLDSKGSAKNGNDSFKLAAKTGASSAKFSARLSKGAFAAALNDNGLTNEDASSKAVAVPVTLIFNKVSYNLSVEQTYKAKTGKTGASK